MTPLKQKLRHDPKSGIYGDCHRTAIACVLDMAVEDVPHFYFDGNEDAAPKRQDEWLRSKGLVQILVIYAGESDLKQILAAQQALNPHIYYLLSGRSRNGTNHSVVCKGGRIVHDPALNDSGIVGPCSDGFYWVIYFGALQASDGAR